MIRALTALRNPVRDTSFDEANDFSPIRAAFPVLANFKEVLQPAVEVPIAREGLNLVAFQTPTCEQFVDAQRRDADIVIVCQSVKSTNSTTPDELSALSSTVKALAQLLL